MPYQGRQPGVGVRSRFIFTASGGQTLFSGADDNGKTLAYQDGAYVDVYLNGVMLVPSTDFTATTKTSVTLTSGATASDIVEIVAYDISSIADTVSKSQGGTFDNDITINGDLTVDTNTLYVDSANNRVGVGTSSPSHNLHVSSSAGSTLALTAGSTENAQVRFGDSSDDDAGKINYDNSTNHMAFHTNASERMRILSSGAVGINTTSPAGTFQVEGGEVFFTSTGNSKLQIKGGNTDNSFIEFADPDDGNVGRLLYDHSTNSMQFTVNAGERMRIDSGGQIIIGKTSTSFATAGTVIYGSGGQDSVNDGEVIAVHRISADGIMVGFYQDGTKEGEISVSGTAVSYNGGHLARWSQTADKTRIDGLLKGTVLSNLDEMCEWFRVEFEYQRLVSEAIEAKDAVLDEEGNVVEEAIAAQDAVYETRTTSEPYDGAANVGDVVDWTYEGQAVQATVIREDNEQLNRMKVSDVEGDPNVAGVFVNWDDDDDVNTADMNIAMTGDMIIRIAQGVTVQRGDLLMSAGDGTAKPQGDDIVRSKTIAKVTSTHVTYTYDDGSYCVPCVLMAC